MSIFFLARFVSSRIHTPYKNTYHSVTLRGSGQHYIIAMLLLKGKKPHERCWVTLRTNASIHRRRDNYPQLIREISVRFASGFITQSTQEVA
jgi:hypothetical protein